MDAGAKVKAALERLKQAKLIAILRAKNPDVAIARGIELAEMGCGALEVTMDSVDVIRILKTLAEKVGHKTLVGVGTVEDKAQIEAVADAGARFALSPVNPYGMIAAAHSRGMLAMPACFTPQELHEAHNQGALCMKLFPAQLWTPDALKDVKGIGAFSTMEIFPSGGISPETAPKWLAAGASGVGMGSKLAGGDIKVPVSDTKKLADEQEKWASSGKQTAQELLNSLVAVKSRL